MPPGAYGTCRCARDGPDGVQAGTGNAPERHPGGPRHAARRPARGLRRGPSDAIPRRARLVSLCDGEVVHLDAGLADLFGELDRRGLLANALVVVTADPASSSASTPCTRTATRSSRRRSTSRCSRDCRPRRPGASPSRSASPVSPPRSSASSASRCRRRSACRRSPATTTGAGLRLQRGLKERPTYLRHDQKDWRRISGRAELDGTTVPRTAVSTRPRRRSSIGTASYLLPRLARRIVLGKPVRTAAVGDGLPPEFPGAPAAV